MHIWSWFGAATTTILKVVLDCNQSNDHNQSVIIRLYGCVDNPEM